MSGRQAKKVRKQINSLIEQRTMEQQQKPQFALKQLEMFVELHVFLTGKKPEKLELVPAYYNFYVQEINFQAEALGLNPGFSGETPTFMGIPLEKKVEIAVASADGSVK